LGIENVSDKELLEVAKLACAPGETIHNMYIKVTPEYVMNIMKAADAYAQSVK
jgi:glycerol dehydrogenase